MASDDSGVQGFCYRIVGDMFAAERRMLLKSARLVLPRSVLHCQVVSKRYTEAARSVKEVILMTTHDARHSSFATHITHGVSRVVSVCLLFSGKQFLLNHCAGN